jgi:hypothetical protein
MMAKNVMASMESLEIDLVATHNSPTLFKACNKTYLLTKKMVKIFMKVDLKLIFVMIHQACLEVLISEKVKLHYILK